MAQANQIKVKEKHLTREELAKFARTSSPLKDGYIYVPQYENECVIVKEVLYKDFNGDEHSYAGVEMKVGIDKDHLTDTKYISMNVFRSRILATYTKEGVIQETTFEATFPESTDYETIFDALNADKNMVFEVKNTQYFDKYGERMISRRMRVLVKKA